MASLAGLIRSVRSQSVEDLPLASSALLTFVTRGVGIVLAATAGIVVARSLGPTGRGIYGLVTSTGLVFAAFAGLGISYAGIYLSGQKRFNRQVLLSNSLAWGLVVSSLWISGVLFTRALNHNFFDTLGEGQLAVAVAGGGVILLISISKDFLLAHGDIWAFNAVQFMESISRLAFIVAALIFLGLTDTAAVGAWLIALLATAALGVYSLTRYARILPALNIKAFTAQVSFGIRGYMGYVFQAANHRLDVFFVAYFVGPAAVGYYAVGFGIAELLWEVPLALGTVLFPKGAALDARSNSRMAAAICRRTLFLTVLGIIALLALGRLVVLVLYGSEFLPSLGAFYILLPSALFFTIHKVLGSSLAGQGVPQATLYGGMLSVPAMVALNVILLPQMGIKGAAIASDVAYAINAAVILLIFRRVARLPLRETLLITRADLAESFRSARRMVAKVWA